MMQKIVLFGALSVLLVSLSYRLSFCQRLIPTPLQGLGPVCLNTLGFTQGYYPASFQDFDAALTYKDVY
jgi:hypothetical protein